MVGRSSKVVVVFVLGALVACRTSRTEAEAPANAGDDDAPLVATVAPLGDAGGRARVDAGAPGLAPVFERVDYAGDGTLLASSATMLLARARDGSTRERPLPKGSTLHVDSGAPGVVVQRGDDVTLLATPSLDVLYEGPGAPAEATPTAIVLRGSGNVVVASQNGGGLVKMALPPGATAHVHRVDRVAGGTRFDVTYDEAVTADETRPTARLYDATTGVLVGRGVPLFGFSAEPPAGGLARDVGFVVEGRSLARVDLRSGAVQKKAALPCPATPERPLGNPTPARSGRLLLVTCGADGMVVDGASLAVLRRIPRVVPGCDNAWVLGGRVLDDDRTMRVEGCGGHADLDLATGRYVCGDAEGLLGAEYVMAPPDPAAAPQPPRLPAGRANVPRCAKTNDQTATLGTSDRYTLVLGEHLAIAHGDKRIALERDATYNVVLAPDEASFAYVRGGRAVVRSLPDGAVTLELPSR